MDTYARGLELILGLENLGTRATMDMALASPPCVLVVPPNVAFDLPCGVTASWQLVALVPAGNTANRDTWQALERLVNNLSQVADISEATLVSYTLNGRTYPAYLVTYQEAI